VENTAIILAGGGSSRLGQDKGLVKLAGKPLIRHVLDKVESLVDEKLVVVSSEDQTEPYAKEVGSRARVIADDAEFHGPLGGAATGFEKALGKYSLLVACDTPFASRDVLQLLLELSVDKNAVIPRWPNCFVEPLQAVYCTKPALEAARDGLRSGEVRMQAMVNRLRNIRYVSTIVLEQLDPGLRTFFNVNTPLDLKKAEAMFKVLKAR
jgi:molybdopterin-guanine dinucleotide biosynthesis protein A